MEICFKGKRALVTGAAQGVGRGIAIKLVKCGATVIALDISNKKLDQLKSEVSSVETVVANLSDWKATAKAVRSVCPLDIVVNNAGVAIVDPLSVVSEEQYEKMFSINVKALINVTKNAIHDMVTRRTSGSIVNISSKASKAALLNHTLYCATKGAVDAFTRAVALEYGPHLIRINSVNPTIVMMTELERKVRSDPKVGEPMLAKIPLMRFAEIDDVVNAVMFLLSDHAKMVTGTCLPVDGGFLAC